MLLEYDLSMLDRILRVEIKGSYYTIKPVVLWREIFEQAANLGAQAVLFISYMVDQIKPSDAKAIGELISEYPQIKGVVMVPMVIPNTARLKNLVLTKVFAGYSGSQFRTMYEEQEAIKWLKEMLG